MGIVYQEEKNSNDNCEYYLKALYEINPDILYNFKYKDGYKQGFIKSITFNVRFIGGQMINDVYYHLESEGQIYKFIKEANIRLY